ncbi:MAG: ATP-binding protein [Rubrivivax sp.]|nr:ATP-binding protein [Rubrivivax sp.]
MADALRVAIVGAESTGKTTLAAQLAPRLAHDTGLRVAWVPELLREWCDRSGRTPLAHEQAAILRAQHERIEAAAAVHDVVVCDTTALLTAVYSRLIFNDRSLDELALALHGSVALTLLTALDLPWVADGQQRDGEHVREPVDALLRELLVAHRLPWAVIGGAGPARLQQAVNAVAPLLRPPAAAGLGRFTRLVANPATTAAWYCDCCGVPEYERALRRR